mgnify:CR=1 FL=1
MEEKASWGFLLMHRAIRQDLDRIAEAAGRVRATDDAAIARFAKWVEFLWMMVEHHHHNEDDTMFPLVRELDSTFDPGPLEAEHRGLDGLFAAVRGALAGKGDLAAACAGLRDSMVAHLDREEAECVERIDALFAPDVVKRLEQASMKKTPMKISLKMLPWIMSGATKEEQAAIRARLPFAIRIVNDWWWTPSFDRAAMTP